MAVLKDMPIGVCGHMCVCWAWALERRLCLGFARSWVGWWVWRSQGHSHGHLQFACSTPASTPHPTAEFCSLALDSRGTHRKDRPPCHCLHSAGHPPPFMVTWALTMYSSNIPYLVKCVILRAILWNSYCHSRFPDAERGIKELVQDHTVNEW